jgi:hypothetical protein
LHVSNREFELGGKMKMRKQIQQWQQWGLALVLAGGFGIAAYSQPPDLQNNPSPDLTVPQQAFPGIGSSATNGLAPMTTNQIIPPTAPQTPQPMAPQGVPPTTPQGVQPTVPQGVQPTVPEGLQPTVPPGVQPLTPQTPAPVSPHLGAKGVGNELTIRPVAGS